MPVPENIETWNPLPWQICHTKRKRFVLRGKVTITNLTFTFAAKPSPQGRTIGTVTVNTTNNYPCLIKTVQIWSVHSNSSKNKNILQIWGLQRTGLTTRRTNLRRRRTNLRIRRTNLINMNPQLCQADTVYLNRKHTELGHNHVNWVP